MSTCPSKKRRKIRLFCSEIFDDDYCNKYNLKYHKALVLNRKQIPYEFLGAPSNPFAELGDIKDDQS